MPAVREMVRRRVLRAIRRLRSPAISESLRAALVERGAARGRRPRRAGPRDGGARGDGVREGACCGRGGGGVVRAGAGALLRPARAARRQLRSRGGYRCGRRCGGSEDSRFARRACAGPRRRASAQPRSRDTPRVAACRASAKTQLAALESPDPRGPVEEGAAPPPPPDPAKREALEQRFGRARRSARQRRRARWRKRRSAFGAGAARQERRLAARSAGRPRAQPSASRQSDALLCPSSSSSSDWNASRSISPTGPGTRSRSRPPMTPPGQRGRRDARAHRSGRLRAAGARGPCGCDRRRPRRRVRSSACERRRGGRCPGRPPIATRFAAQPITSRRRSSRCRRRSKPSRTTENRSRPRRRRRRRARRAPQGARDPFAAAPGESARAAQAGSGVRSGRGARGIGSVTTVRARAGWRRRARGARGRRRRRGLGERRSAGAVARIRGSAQLLQGVRDREAERPAVEREESARAAAVGAGGEGLVRRGRTWRISTARSSSRRALARRLASFAAAPVGAQEVRVEVDPGPHYQGEPIELQVVATQFEEEPAPAVEFDPQAGLSLRFLGVSPSTSTSISIINGQCQPGPRGQLHLPLRAVEHAQSASLRVPEFRVRQGTTLRQTEPFTLEIAAVQRSDEFGISVVLPEGPIFVGQRVPVAIEFRLDKQIQRELLKYRVQIPLFDVPGLRFVDSSPSRSDTSARGVDRRRCDAILAAISEERTIGGRTNLVVRAERTLIAQRPGEIRAGAPTRLDRARHELSPRSLRAATGGRVPAIGLARGGP